MEWQLNLDQSACNDQDIKTSAHRTAEISEKTEGSEILVCNQSVRSNSQSVHSLIHHRASHIRNAQKRSCNMRTLR